jgi:PIN domain nuclease of toxin-antitoxin system
LRGQISPGVLLDTNAALFALAAPARLSAAARAAILAGPNMLSVVSYWEVMIKNMKGALDVGDPRSWWRDALHQLAAAPLPLRAEHVAGVYSLPPHHKDPFDRVLIAQAIADRLVFVSSDAEAAKYSSAGLQLVI